MPATVWLGDPMKTTHHGWVVTRVRFADLPGWAFSIERRSAGAYVVHGESDAGRTVRAEGDNPEVLLEECREIVEFGDTWLRGQGLS